MSEHDRAGRSGDGPPAGTGPGESPRNDGDRADEVLGAWRDARDRGEAPTLAALLAAHPDLRDTLQARIEAMAVLDAALGEPPRRGAGLRPVHDDRYDDFRVLGQGGMGIVYWAIDTDLNRHVAFKVVRPDAGIAAAVETPPNPISMRPPSRGTPASQAFETLKSRFLQEALVTAGLEHPGIVPVYEVGRTPDGVPYYTMRFVRGSRTLAKSISGVAGLGFDDRLQLLEPFLKVCDTIRYAHSRGVIHRDLKPENIAIGEFGEVVVLDWGLAKVQGTPDAAAGPWQARLLELREMSELRTVAGAMGTPGYMSPEAALGRIAEVDERSDVFALGAILFESLTGRLPHEFRSYAELVSRLQEGPDPDPRALDPAVPAELAGICTRALARDRDARTPSADRLASDVREWVACRAADRETDALRQRAAAACDAAADLTGEQRLLQLDRAAALVSQVLDRRTDDVPAGELRTEITRLRGRGVEERARAVRRSALRRAGIVALTGAAAAAIVVGKVLDDRRLETEAERDAKSAALTRAVAAEKTAERERDEQVRQTARAVAAEAETRERLRDSYAAQARAARISSRAGRRHDALAALAAAAAIRSSAELRDEAIAALALDDLRVTAAIPARAADAGFIADRTFERVAVCTGGEFVEIRPVGGTEGRVLRRLVSTGERSWMGGFSDDGRLLWTKSHRAGDDDHPRVRIWDTRTGEILVDEKGAACAAFAPDCVRVAIGWPDGRLEERALDGGGLLSRWDAGIQCHRIAYAPEGDRIAVSGFVDCAVAVADAGKVTRIGHSSTIRGIAWSGDGNRLATGCGDCFARVWDVSGAPRLLHQLEHEGEIVSVALTPDGETLATTAWDGTLRLFAPERGRDTVMMMAYTSLIDFSPDLTGLGLRVAPGGQEVVGYTSPANVTRRVRVGTRGRAPGPGASVSPDGAFVATASDATRILDAATLDVLADVPAPGREALFGGRGDEIAVVGEESVTVLPFAAPSGGAPAEAGPPRTLRDVAGRWVLTLAAVPRSAHWAGIVRARGGPAEVVLLDLGDGASRPSSVLRVFGDVGGDRGSVAVSPDGRWLAVGRWRNPRIVVWDMESGRRVLDEPLEESVLPSFSPAGRALVVGTRFAIRRWDTDTWTAGPKVTRDDPVDWATVAWSPDERLLGVSIDARTVRILDAASFRVIATLAAPERITPGIFLGDGRRVLTWAREHAARVWDLAAMRDALAGLGIDVPELPASPPPAGVEGAPTGTPRSVIVHLSARGARKLADAPPDFAAAAPGSGLRRAVGVRKVLVLVRDTARAGAGAVPPDEVDRVLFGAKPSVADWVAENSRGRLRIERAGPVVVVRADAAAAGSSGATDHRTPPAARPGGAAGEPPGSWAALLRAADRGVDFSAYDIDRDGVVGPDELTVVIVDPADGPDAQPGAGSPGAGAPFGSVVLDGVRIPAVTEWRTGTRPSVGAGVRAFVRAMLGNAPSGTPVDGAAGPGCWTQTGGPESVAHLGAFEKLKLGWTEPVVVRADADEDLPAIAASGRVLVVHEPECPGEYLLVENRRRIGTYDAGLPGIPGAPADGVVVWHVSGDTAPHGTRGSPPGGPQSGATVRVRLVRADGGVTGNDAAAALVRRGSSLSDAVLPGGLLRADGSPAPVEVELRTPAGPVVRVAVRFR